jgi:2-oxoglutarate ferredoxin oxidoreductase subunit beta
MRGTEMEVIELGADDRGASECVVWDECLENPATAFLASQLLPPHFPTAVGVLRTVSRPTYEAGVVSQIEHEIERAGAGKLEDLLRSGDTWTVPSAAS